MKRQPTISTLFPYTTLFRSIHHDLAHSSGIKHRDDGAHLAVTGRAVDHVVFERGGEGEDRKSTRLNSSHVENSYAVFCLKKKTIGRMAEHLLAIGCCC